MSDVSNSVRKGGRGEVQSGGPENRPSKTAMSLKPCIWYRLLCHKCGECYSAQPTPVASLKCPKCRSEISVQYLCKGLTVASLPHFSAVRVWIDTKGSRTIEQRTNFVNQDPDYKKNRDLYYQVDLAIERERQYQDREVRVQHIHGGN